MGTQDDDAGTSTRARAGTFAVIGTMAAIAVVTVTAVVAWARIGPGDAPEEPRGITEEMPETLAGGAEPQPVPQEVAAAVDGPVLGALPLDELPDDMRAACLDFDPVTWEPGSPKLQSGVITPDGVTATLFGQGEVPGGMSTGPGGEPPIGIRIRCDLDIEDGTPVNRGGGGFEEVFADQPDSGGHFSGSSCCDRNGLGTASASVSVPPEASWLLQDRGGWYLAIPVGDADQMTLTWKFRENMFGGGNQPQSRVLFLDDSGDLLTEDYVGGAF